MTKTVKIEKQQQQQQQQQNDCLEYKVLTSCAKFELKRAVKVISRLQFQA